MNTDLRERIRLELENLNSAFSGKTSRVKELVDAFIANTGIQLSSIDELLNTRQFTEAARAVHKIKPRYGYFGLQDLVADLELWEDELKNSGSVLNHHEALKYIRKRTESVIEELKQTEYFEEGDGLEARPLPYVGKMVLVAEDDEVNGMVFELFIKESGAETILATDGMLALTLAREKNPDLIFMDVHMPFFSGLDAIRELRKTGCKCPIVSLSASTRLNERQNSLDAGADDFLIKPVNRDAMNRILTRFLS